MSARGESNVAVHIPKWTERRASNTRTYANDEVLRLVMHIQRPFAKRQVYDVMS
jgi:hypothetical protein